MSYVSPRLRVCVAAPGPSWSLTWPRVPGSGERACPLHPKAFNLAPHAAGVTKDNCGMKWNMHLRQVNSVRQWINSEKESEGETFSSCQRWLEQTVGAPTFIGQLLVIRWAELIKKITQNASAETAWWDTSVTVLSPTFGAAFVWKGGACWVEFESNGKTWNTVFFFFGNAGKSERNSETL